MTSAVPNRPEGFHAGQASGSGMRLLLRGFSAAGLGKLAVAPSPSSPNRKTTEPAEATCPSAERMLATTAVTNNKRPAGGCAAAENEHAGEDDEDERELNEAPSANVAVGTNKMRKVNIEAEHTCLGNEKDKEKGLQRGPTTENQQRRHEHAHVVTSVSGPAFYHPRTGEPVFTFGNYESYYNYRTRDVRVAAVAEKIDLAGKSLLDVGCNSGQLTAELAEISAAGGRRCSRERHHEAVDPTCSTSGPSSPRPPVVVGCDIDASLIAKACCRYLVPDSAVVPAGLPPGRGDLYFEVANFASDAGTFAFSRDQGLALVREEDFAENRSQLDDGQVVAAPRNKTKRQLFDVVFAFSVTKWVHFQYGDAGVRRFFDQIWSNLASGGFFVLEPQPWATYKKKRHITPEIRKTVAEIELFPEAFEEYLTSSRGADNGDAVAGRPRPGGANQNSTNSNRTQPGEGEDAIFPGGGAKAAFELKHRLSGAEMPGFDRDVFIYRKK